MSDWIEYQGTDEQIKEMRNAEHGFIFRDVNNEECNNIKYIPDFMGRHHLKKYLTECEAIHYLICNHHPLADMIKRQADTGQPVYVRPKAPYSFNISDYQDCAHTKLLVDQSGVVLLSTKPDWNIPGAEYSFTPFSEK